MPVVYVCCSCLGCALAPSSIARELGGLWNRAWHTPNLSEVRVCSPVPPPLPHSHPAAGTSPTLLGAPFGGSTVYAVHASQVLATPFSTLVNLLGVQPRLECVTINPMGTDLAYGTRVVVTTAGVRKQLMRLNLFTGAVTTFVTGTGYLR